MTRESIISECLSMVRPVEEAFRSRWRLSTLKRIDPELHGLLQEQIDLFESSLVTGTDAETREQAAAMVRGWEAAWRRLELEANPDDAYMAGYDEMTMTKVIIGPTAKSIARVQHIAGQRLVMITPDEVARLIGGMGALIEVKAVFPDSEVLSAAEAER